jgi:quinol monooxygenase YgiN
MLTRLVKMNFHPDKTEEFLKIFTANKKFIAAFPGCTSLQLKRDINTPTIFFTISEWNSEADLENYRNSDLFKSVWAKTKVLFNEKPQAWTLSDPQI